VSTVKKDKAMEVLVEHLGSVQFEITARQHRVVSDQPVEQGGFDEGMTPPELMLASLAQYLKKHKLATEGTRVRVIADKEKSPARLDNFRIEVEVPAELGKEHEAGVEEAVHHCLIHNTLLIPPKIELNVKSMAAQTA
jgi:uncharacterized OsmC-like protein